tara:strand:- start:138 stop:761 length:624 start_codon:yes stop_codon:yes gene_type:complete
MNNKIWNFLFSKTNRKKDVVKKFLIVGLGNPGSEYKSTRHNIGFSILDHYASKKEIQFEDLRYGSGIKTKWKGKSVILLKPSTYMNLSGKAINYWKNKENISLENILIITDDLNLPYGLLRLRAKGSDGGHNGLKDIQNRLNSINYSRLRFGIKTENSIHNTVDFVLGNWNEQEKKTIDLKISKTIEIIDSFVSSGVENTMNYFNGK